MSAYRKLIERCSIEVNRAHRDGHSQEGRVAAVLSEVLRTLRAVDAMEEWRGFRSTNRGQQSWEAMLSESPLVEPPK